MTTTIDFKESVPEFLKFLRGVQIKAKKRGLTEKILNKILNDKT